MKRTALPLAVLLFALTTPAARAVDLFQNLSFEVGSGSQPAGWRTWGEGTFLWDATSGRTGSHSLRVSTSGWNVGWTSDMAGLEWLGPQTYGWVQVSARIRTNQASGRNFVAIAWFDDKNWICSAEGAYAECGTSNGWVQISTAGLPPRGATRLQLALRSDNNSGDTWFDDVAVTVTQLPRAARAMADQPADLEAYLAFVADYPGDPLAKTAYAIIAQKLRAAGKLADAVAVWQMLLQSAEDQQAAAKAEFSIGELLSESHDWQAALQLYQYALQSYPDEATKVQALQRLGDTYEKSGDVAKAVETYQRIVDEHPPFVAEGLFRIGIAYNESKQFDKAIDPLLQARAKISLEPSMKDYLQPLQEAIAYNYYSRRQFEAARAEAELFLQTYPANLKACAVAQHIVASSLEQQGEFTAAIEAYRREVTILKKSPASDAEMAQTMASALQGIGHNCERTGDLAGATETYEQLVAEYPEEEATTFARERLAVLKGSSVSPTGESVP